MTEQWIRWEPLQGLAKKYFIDSVSNNKDGFKIILSEYPHEYKKIAVIFKNSVDSYRETDESFRLTTLHILSQKYGDAFYGNWTFFKVDNSSYIQWLFNESYVYKNTAAWKHFAFMAGDSILDVVAGYEPVVEFLNVEEKLS